MQRRDFIQLSSLACAATTVSLARAAQPLTVQSDDSLPIIDTHQHLWDLKQFTPPWLSGAPAVVAAKHDMEDYLAETAGLNLKKAIYMEVDVAVEDQNKEADFILEIIKSKTTPTVAAVISGRPGSEQFAKYMERFRQEEAIKGVRQVLHAGSAVAGLCLQPQFVKSIQLLGAMGKCFDLCMRPSELGDGVKLVKQCPETRFVVDHCGNADPHAWGKGNSQTAPSHTVDQWKRDMEALAAHANVVCKISGIVARMPEGWQADDLAPAINYCLDTFGPDRVMFAGDWPVCKIGASFARWVAGLQEIVANRPLAQRQKLFHDNAARFYGVGA